jgi:hypothetical protein
MKMIHSKQEGSVLVIAILTITILTLICATTLHVTTQNAAANMQTASWQGALSGAETGVDAAMNALNTNSWTNWSNFAGAPGFTMPVASPTPAPPATGVPALNSFNYLPEASSRSLSLAGEGNNILKMWVTVDTAQMPRQPIGGDPFSYIQPYRIRATGTAQVPGPVRVSNQRLDDDLRNISLRFDHNTNTAVSSPQVSRKIEVIALLEFRNIWGRGLLMKKSINMSGGPPPGGGWIDSFNSGDPRYSTNGLYDITKRESHGDIATTDSTNSDLRHNYIYGGVAYSGPAIKDTDNVQGTISTPFYATIPPTLDPASDLAGGYIWTDPNQRSPYLWPAGTYTQYGGGNPNPPASITATGSSALPALIVINGDFTVPGGRSFTINATTYPPGSPHAGQPDPSHSYVTIWVKGKFTTSGSGYITQANGVHVTWIVDNDITVSGSSFNNLSGLAQNMSLIGVGSHSLTDSGSGTFIGTVNAPGYNYTISGAANYSGAFIGNTISITGGASVHYDEALAGSTNANLVGNVSYANWFEDNSDPTHKWQGLDRQWYKTIY